MTVKYIYKRLLPLRVRNAIVGHPWVLRWRNRQLVREGERLAARTSRDAGKSDQIRVTFLVQREGYWPNQKTIYESMIADPAFNVSVIAIPKVPPAASAPDPENYRSLLAFLREQDMTFHMGYDLESNSWVNPLIFGVPDIVFLPQPYAFTQSYLYHGSYLSHFCRIAYVHYGIMMANLPEVQYHAPFYSTCWRVFVEGPSFRKLFVENAPEMADRLVVTGHPVLDIYRVPARTAGLWKMKSARKRIIWAPHFTVTRDRTPHAFSNFFKYYEYFLQAAGMYPDIEFVLRPHPELFAHMVAAGLKTREEAEEYRRRFNVLPNGQVYEGGEIFELFKESDALILDSLGFLAAYLPAGKPICFLESQFRQRLNMIGEALLATYYTAWNIQDIDEFIRHVVLEDVDGMKPKRQEALAAHLLMPPGGAGNAIAAYIKMQLKGK